jgi:(p)ppGpp synthase/HD superfamily hydrolase
LRAGYPEAGIECVHAAYDLAARLFASGFRGSGKPFLAHGLGTAGILGGLRVPAPVIAAGLLHAAYTLGEFGDGQPGNSDARRQQVRRAVGAEAEELVTRYTALAWNDRTVLRLRGMLSELSADDRAVILMRLANELEDHLDLGIGYCRDAEQRRQQIRGWLHVCVDLAEELRQPELARALRRAFEAALSATVPQCLVSSHTVSYTLAPASPPPPVPDQASPTWPDASADSIS